MEVYILDDLLRRNTIIDRFESCIWTERYSAYGDFQLVIHSTQQSRSQLVEGTFLTVNNSKKVMVIENVENRNDSEGRQLLTVTGRSLEAWLEDRSVRPNMQGSNFQPTFELAPNPPATALRSLFNYICVAGSLDPGDVIPMITSGNLYPVNTIAEPEGVVTLAFDPTNLYDALKKACDVYGLGFRLYRGPDTSLLYFNIYTGNDRTASQTTLPAVVFAPDLENFGNTAEFRSIEKYKNVALVVGRTRSVWAYANTEAQTATGFDRRVLTYAVTDIDYDKYDMTEAEVDVVAAAITLSTNATHDELLARLVTNTTMTPTESTLLRTNYVTGGSLTTDQKTVLGNIITRFENYRDVLAPAIDAELKKRGEDELTKHRPLKAMDGELNVNSKYRYTIDYELGDIVETRNDDGLTNRMRVTENIRIDDVQGERDYPTLQLDEFITPGVWYAWDANGVWDTALGVWDDQPA